MAFSPSEAAQKTAIARFCLGTEQGGAGFFRSINILRTRRPGLGWPQIEIGRQSQRRTIHDGELVRRIAAQTERIGDIATPGKRGGKTKNGK